MVDDEEATAAKPASDGSPVAPHRSARPGWMTITAIVLVAVGVLLMVLPGLVRDGFCGLVSCASVTPQIAVGKPTGTELAVVVPEDAAAELRSLRLYPVTNQTLDTAGVWIISRTGKGSPTTIPLGSEPDGFTTRTKLTDAPVDGTWVVEASFGCSSTPVRFVPDQIEPGYVATGDNPAAVDPVKVDDFLANARTTLRCSTQAPAWQRWLFLLGALSVCVGAVLGIVVVLRRPPPDDSDWYGP